MQNWFFFPFIYSKVTIPRAPGIRPESLMLQIRQLLMEGNAGIQGPGEYSEQEARAGFAMAKVFFYTFYILRIPECPQK